MDADGSRLRELSPSDGARCRYSCAYTPEAPCPRWLQFLEESFAVDRDGAEKIALLQEFVGACLFGVAPRFERVFLLIGCGANGKSTFISVVSGLFPPGTVSAIAPQHMAHDYSAAALAGVQLNACNELPDLDILSSERFKCIVSGQAVQARRIYGSPFIVTPIAGHLFACNELPGSVDGSEGFWRRWCVVSFNRQVEEHAQIKGFAEVILADERAGVLAWGVEGARRLLRAGRYSVAPSSRADTEEWKREANPQC